MNTTVHVVVVLQQEHARARTIRAQEFNEQFKTNRHSFVFIDSFKDPVVTNTAECFKLYKIYFIVHHQFT